MDGLDDEYIDLAFKILKEYEKGSNTKPYNLRRLDRRKVKQKVQEVDEILSYITTKDITERNNLMRAAAVRLLLGDRWALRKEEQRAHGKNHHGNKGSEDISRLDCILRGGGGDS